MENFQVPDFISNETVESIHARMMKALPDDIDKSEGQFAWDFTRPTALEKQYFVEFVLLEAIKMIFPMYSSGEFLDYHAKLRNMLRKAATAATCIITVTGSPGIIIPKNSMFSTESDGSSSIDFLTVQDAVIPENGNVQIPVMCSEAGSVGNVGIGTITIKSSNLSNGITNVINNDAASGGTDEETDEDFRNRIVEYDKNIDVSYVGSIFDYRRWALSVDGVGEAIVIPASDDSGTVTIVILDSNGAPATEQLCKAVSDYIMRPDDSMARLAPINAVLEVKPPQTRTISVSAHIKLNEGAVLNDVKKSFNENLKQYFISAVNEEEIKYSKIGAVLLSTNGISDYISTSLKVNGSTSNISVSKTELPVCSEDNITLTV